MKPEELIPELTSMERATEIGRIMSDGAALAVTALEREPALAAMIVREDDLYWETNSVPGAILFVAGTVVEDPDATSRQATVARLQAETDAARAHAFALPYPAYNAAMREYNALAETLRDAKLEAARKVWGTIVATVLCVNAPESERADYDRAEPGTTVLMLGH